MKKRIKKIALYTLSVFLLLTIVLGVHIYMVTRPKAPDATTRIMARIDVKQDISAEDAQHITAWLYGQQGIDHVLCNAESNIIVFTFFPVKTNANKIVNDFKANFHLKAERFMPTEEEIKAGCPVAAGSFGTKLHQLFKHIF